MGEKVNLGLGGGVAVDEAQSSEPSENLGMGDSNAAKREAPSNARRHFVGALGAASLGVLFAKTAKALTVGPLNPTQRRDAAYNIRANRAVANRNQTPLTPQSTNGDEEQLANKIGNYTKGLPHNNRGEVDIAAFSTLDFALRNASVANFDAVTLGGTRKLTNPLGGWTFEMEGGDGPAYRIAAPPKFDSREIAAEISENYWMALLRDVPFSQYSTNPIAIDAAADMTAWGPDAKVPKSGGVVTPDLLFRGFTLGDRNGPFLSQFLVLPCPFGANMIEQRILHPTASNFMTTFTDFLAVQNGSTALPPLTYENTLRYMRSGRGIGEWVHVDVLFQAYFMAFLILASIGAPLDTTIPYVSSSKQIGFTTFGGPHIATLLCEVSTRALHATWYQKWFAHRRLRPEAYAGAAHTRLYDTVPGDGSQNRFPVHQELLDSLSSSSRLGKYYSGTAVLPMAFPEGSPTHPAYTAGHATVAGACTTIIKAFFDESWVIPDPKQVSDDGLSLQNYTGSSLTVGGELNKLASNIANGRNIAGVHWRSDSTASIALGEAIAIQLLTEHRATFAESFPGFTLRKFDGTVVTI